MARINVSEPTPVATDRQRRQFYILIEPPTRDRAPTVAPATIGDVLDAPPVECKHRAAVYSSTWGKIFIRPPERCGKRSCPTCIVERLDRVADAWTYWGGVAQVVVVADAAKRGHRPFRVAGSNAQPGVLSVPQGDGRVYIASVEDEVLGDVLRGEMLDAEVVRLIRAVNLEPKRRGEPSECRFTIPKTWTKERMLAACAMAGVTAEVRSHGGIVAVASSEQFAALRRIVWDHRRDNLPGPVGQVAVAVDVLAKVDGNGKIRPGGGKIRPGGEDNGSSTNLPTIPSPSPEAHEGFNLSCLLYDLVAERGGVDVDGTLTYLQDHDRTQWARGGATRLRMAQAHGLRLASGHSRDDDATWEPIREAVVEMVSDRQGRWYPREYVERLRRDGEDVSEFDDVPKEVEVG